MKTGLILFSFFLAPSLWADDVLAPATEFHHLFKQSIPAPLREKPAARFLHFVPDENLIRAAQSHTIQEAIKLAEKATIETLTAATDLVLAKPAINVDQILRKKPLTLVIIPGIFGEFIKTRPFEEIFERPSRFREEWEKLVDDAPTALGSDLSYSSATVKDQPLSMKELVQVGSIDDEQGVPLVCVVFLYPPYASLETLGDLKQRATILNRRLEKYLTLTGAQDLAIIGYSRGTTYGLEMLAQAKASNATWLYQVKGMIALGGVIWGSTSADQTVDPNDPMSKMVVATRKLAHDLSDPGIDAGWLARVSAAWDNTQVITAFVTEITQLPKDDQPVAPLASELNNRILAAAVKMDFMNSMVFLYKALAEIIWEHRDMSNISRAKNLISAALVGIDQLRTEQRLEWWKQANLPAHFTYYALTAVMPNANDSELSRAAAESDIAFTKGSFEDAFLLKGRNDYARASKLVLNDSQVGVVQAMFLPNIMQAMNSSHRGLRTQYLGAIGTHHWGAALKIVFEMRSGATNPFPREALLKAIAAKVATDQR